MVEADNSTAPAEVQSSEPKHNSPEFAKLVVEHTKLTDPKKRKEHFEANPALARIFDPINYK